MFHIVFEECETLIIAMYSDFNLMVDLVYSDGVL